MFKNKVTIDFNMVEQIKEVKQYWNQNTAIAKKKRKEFLDNAYKVGGVVLVSYLIGNVRGLKKGATFGQTYVVNELERRR